MFEPKWSVIRNCLSPHRWIKLALGTLVATAIASGLAPRPSFSAERIYVSYSVFERSISVAALETYAREGILNDELSAYARYASPQQLEQLKQLLTQRLDVDVVVLSRFLYTFQGEALLDLLGEVIQTENRLTGFYALRAALILAASDPEGLTLLNVLRHYPTAGLRIDLDRSLQIADELQTVVANTRLAIERIKRQARLEAEAAIALDFSDRPDLRKPGPFAWKKRTLSLVDPERDRTFLADLYLPARPTPAPLTIISHGFGSDRTSFAYLGEHLASYGFAVAIPDHPGSNAEQVQKFLRGKTSTAIETSEALDRPLDISLLLDALARGVEGDETLKGRLDPTAAAVIGQSFGGYTALVVAGAEIDFEQLKTDCPKLKRAWNLSLLLQCQAQRLSAARYPKSGLRDPRVKAAIAINPINSSILGPKSLSQIQVPIMIVSATADTVAPPLAEQIQPFTWLTAPQKYLAVLHQGTHFSTIGDAAAGSEGLPIPAETIGPSPPLARSYLSALSTAFLKAHLEAQPQYRDYLTAAYAQKISTTPIALSLVQDFTVFPFRRE